MYCNNCGNEIAAHSKFCSYCGSPVEAVPAPEPVVAPTIETEQPAEVEKAPRDPFFEEIKWDVSDYPGSEPEKTEDINFDWNANPQEIPDVSPRRRVGVPAAAAEQQAEDKSYAAMKPVTPGDVKASVAEEKPLSAADRIDKFYTFNRKNEEFQQLLNREYEKVKSGNAIEHELSQAEELAAQRFESRPEDSSMEAFLEKEGIVKPYQPKAFESDVLQRIEAQEAEKEAKRLEEEARLAAIEEARKAAAEEAAKKAEEEARLAAEEEARAATERARIEAEAEAKRKAEEEAARLEEIAKRKAEEEARQAEEQRLREAEEARLRAEEEERRRIEEEARRAAEAEAKVKAEEEARLKAEADLRAAQEAAKIKAQQEARRAAEAEARFRANQEKQQLEAIEAQKRLEAHRKKLAEEANQAVAQEEIRRVIEQTARMRDEEAAKIKAAVANMRDGIDNIKEDAAKRTIAEAHQATKNQIDEMAKARMAFFAEEEARPVTDREEMLADSNVDDTKVVDKAAIMRGLTEDTIIASKESTPAPKDDEEFFNSLDAAAVLGTGAAAAAVGAAAAKEEPRPIDFRESTGSEAPKAAGDDLLSQFESVNNLDDLGTLEDVDEADVDKTPEMPEMQEGFELQNDLAEEPAQAFNMGDTIQAGTDMGAALKAESDTAFNETVVMARNEDFSKAAAANDFDNYGNEEAAAYIRQQNMNAEANNNGFYDDLSYEDEGLSKKELRKREREQRRLEKQKEKEAKILAKRDADFDNVVSKEVIDEDYDEYEEKEGKGRIVLKVVLIVLIVILAVEVVGMGIRFIAPQSKAAEFIDNQLNKVIHLITGDDSTDYVIAAQVRMEPLEDKTELIEAKRNNNVDGNIGKISYNGDLKFKQERDGQISDLVLSQPMTQVEWGRDKDDYLIYYDEEVVGEIISFESNKVNLMNKGDKKALDMIKPDTDLFKQLSKLQNKKMDGSFDKLEIGEIRQTGSNYCVWVSETIGGKTAEKVYVMSPEDGYDMQITACYDL